MMTNINHVLVIMPPQYNHSQAFFDVALSFSQALKTLGHPAEVTIDPSVCFGKTLTFGAHLLPKFNGAIEDGDYIIFNTEQHGSEWMCPEYLDILKRYEVWDYSNTNILALKEHGIEARYCEIGYSPCMSNIRLGKSATIIENGKVDYINTSSAQAPIGVFDVLFYGSMNERRQKTIDDLRACGLNTVVLNAAYGAYRDKYIARAKLVLNMHYYDSAVFESVRVSHLLANQKAVVSETGRDDRFTSGIFFTNYENIVDECTTLINDYDDNQLANLAATGFEEIKKTKQVDILRELM